MLNLVMTWPFLKVIFNLNQNVLNSNSVERNKQNVTVTRENKNTEMIQLQLYKLGSSFELSIVLQLELKMHLTWSLWVLNVKQLHQQKGTIRLTLFSPSITVMGTEVAGQRCLAGRGLSQFHNTITFTKRSNLWSKNVYTYISIVWYIIK